MPKYLLFTNASFKMMNPNLDFQINSKKKYKYVSDIDKQL